MQDNRGFERRPYDDRTVDGDLHDDDGHGEALSGGAAGALAGAAVGSVLPGFGTAVGAVVGGVAGAVTGETIDQADDDTEVLPGNPFSHP